jgi:predicted ArsR family transcriptional regulator
MGNLQSIMKDYFLGFSLGNERELDVVSKESNRTILNALKEVYPSGLNAAELSEKTGLPLKTIYASLKELNVELFINELGRARKMRGRPLTKVLQSNGGERSMKYVIEDMSRIYDIYASYPEGNYPLAPGNSEYSDEFIAAWHKLVSKEEAEEICAHLFNFVEKSLRIVSEHKSDEIKNWAPTNKFEFCCTQCGINHEARDFVRALLLHLIDHFEKHSILINLMKSNGFINQEIYENMQANTGKPKCGL